jgi:hypothetical protein
VFTNVDLIQLDNIQTIGAHSKSLLEVDSSLIHINQSSLNDLSNQLTLLKCQNSSIIFENVTIISSYYEQNPLVVSFADTILIKSVNIVGHYYYFIKSTQCSLTILNSTVNQSDFAFTFLELIYPQTVTAISFAVKDCRSVNYYF